MDTGEGGGEGEGWAGSPESDIIATVRKSSRETSDNAGEVTMQGKKRQGLLLGALRVRTQQPARRSRAAGRTAVHVRGVTDSRRAEFGHVEFDVS